MLYPLRFQEILRNYPFGERWIAQVYEKDGLPADHRLAETWEVCDRPDESSVLINGPLAGRTLHELIDRYGPGLLGSDVVARAGTRFPLLIKFLDASHVLGEQAHHDDELAARRGLTDPGKTEAWYMLHVRDGATIHCGQADDQVDRRAVYEAILDGSCRDLMREIPVHPGDAFLLYAGTMHYSAGGVLFYEIMQNSDVYISLRQPDPSLPQAEREARAAASTEGVHLEPDFDCQATPVSLAEGPNRRTWVMACTYFCLERLDLAAPYILHNDGQRFFVLSQIEGRSAVRGGGVQEVLRPGQTCLLPAALEVVTIDPEPGCALLKTYVPDLVQDVIAPLRAAGVAEEAIAGLGARSKLNPMIALLSQ